MYDPFCHRADSRPVGRARRGTLSRDPRRTGRTPGATPGSVLERAISAMAPFHRRMQSPPTRWPRAGMSARPLPSAAEEIRLLSLTTLRGVNYWSTRPVTRIELRVGAYDEISSADADGVTAALVEALPGLVEHRCSVGRRGGFIERLERGTYAPHILEHVALELQGLIGHEVGYGRARGAGRPGEYTVVFEHLHAGVGLRAAGLALDLVQQAFDGTLVGPDLALAEMRAAASIPDLPPPSRHVLAGVTGSGGRESFIREMLLLGLAADGAFVDLSPGYLLAAGLPYTTSDLAVILDGESRGVPAPYLEPDRARRLASVVADAVTPDGIVIVPAADPELQEIIRRSGRKLAVFSEGDAGLETVQGALAAATIQDGRILLRGSGFDGEAVRVRPGEASPAVQAAAALAATVVRASGRSKRSASSPGRG